MGTAALRLTDVSVTLGDPAREILRGVDLAVSPGEVLAVVGRSGVGKSTLLSVMAGLIRPDSGLVRSELGDGVVRTATVFQQPHLFPWLDVADNVAFPLRLKDHPRAGTRRRHRRQRAHEILEALDIAHLGTRRAAGLSGGEQQRVAIARAVAAEPDVLLLDEPFSALDVATRSSLQEWLVGHRSALGSSVVIVTHDLAEALFVGDRVALLQHGRGGVECWASDVRGRHDMVVSTVRPLIESRLVAG